MTFRLNQPCDNTVEYNGVTYELDLSFDVVLDTISLINQGGQGGSVLSTALALLLMDYKQAKDLTPKEQAELINIILDDVIATGVKSNEPRLDRQGNPLPVAPTATDEAEEGASYDLEHDASYIYTSFRQAYNIDLHKEFGRLTWQQFSALLRDLPNDTAFGKILEIRGTKLSSIKDSKERARMKELQKRYALTNR